MAKKSVPSDCEPHEETFEEMLRRNYRREVVLRPECSGAELAAMNVVRNPADLRKIGQGVVATVRMMRAQFPSPAEYEAYVDKLQALDDATPPFDFELSATD